ncbi:MAG TPA: AAA family ATPase, partial [Myxococcota bacterium]|nr:AAA family ATPase [Myxococcota bacterium]
MITRLHVRGFKNLTDLDVRLGAFNCIAGPNGAGKSNLFDVVALLSRLAAGATLDVAADAVRGGRRQDVAHLFTQGTSSDRRLELVVEMIVPREGVDFLLKQVRASNTFLRYRLVLVPGEGPGGLGSTLRIAEEELVPILKGAWSREICFPHEPSWRDSLLESTREGKYIRTEALGDGGRVIKMFGDSDVGRGRGRPTLASAAALPETMLSKAQDGAAHPTAVLVRREMMSWTQLALEPTRLSDTYYGISPL